MKTRACIILLIAALVVGTVGLSVPAAPDAMARHSFGEVFKKISPGVVRIVDGRQYASGLLIDDRGLIVTYRGIVNHNVMTVYFPDGKKVKARMLIRDKETDLAILRILAEGEDPDNGDKNEEPKEAKPEPKPVARTKRVPVPLGSSKDVGVGDWVATIAYPVGADYRTRQKPSLSAGLLSARGKIPTKLKYAGALLVTDAAANLGSEGGALVSAQGKVVAVLSRPQLYEDTKTALNVALPVEVLPALVKRAIDDPDPPIIEEATAARTYGFLGVIAAPDADKCIIGDVLADGPAQKAGMQAGDRIVKAGETDVDKFEDLIAILKKTKPGDKITLTIKRPGKDEPLEIEVELAAYPKEKSP
jgi:S1-C subfamily serine protease